MPRKQVYGRSRAIYDPCSIFGLSPQRRTPDDERIAPVTNVTKDSSRPAARDESRAKSNIGERKALREINANTVVLPGLQIKRASKKTQRYSGEHTSGDEVWEGEERQTVKKSNETAIYTTSEDAEQMRRKVSKQEREACDDEVDDMPMFCNDHGYDTEEDIVETHSRPVDIDGISNARGESLQAPVLDTPSISILAPTPPPRDEYSEHCAKLLDLSSHSLTKFSEWSDQLSTHFDITKIAEASYGEVYRLSVHQQLELDGFSSNDKSVFKIIALRAPESTLPTDKRKREAAMKKAEGMSTPDDVANEVKLLHRMSTIPGYTNFRDVRVLQGRPPQPFIKAFKAFNAAQKADKKDLSIFPDPSKKASYADDQLWAAIEMQDAGVDLERLVESGQCTRIWFVWDAFWQCVLSLAKGEEGVEFEHRDLHLGNICVRMPAQPSPALDIKRKLNFTGLETTIIDYTISRALMSDDTIAYHDLTRDPGIFEGDSTEEYQYDIYRHMGGAVFMDDPYAEFTEPSKHLEHSGRSWQQYHPVTNLIWLHFILYKLLDQVAWPSSTKAPPRKQKAEHAEWKRANDLEHILLRVQGILDPGVVCEKDVRSSSELVGLALAESWIEDEDVVGAGGDENGLIDQFISLGLQAEPLSEVVQDGADVGAEAVMRPKRSRTRKEW